MIETKFIKAQDFMKFLGISSATFYRGMKSNQYPFNCHVRFRPHGNIYFPKAILTDLTKKTVKAVEVQNDSHHY
jgi:hypothetical protein